MTTPQWLSLATLAGMMALFVWGRFRYDVTAVIALLAAMLVGIVSPKEAFSGFSDDIVIIVGSALVMSAAVQRSGLIDGLLMRIATRVRSTTGQLVLLTTTVGFSSALIKNVGALAMLMPSAVQMAKKEGRSPSVFLMPMAFASLLGGLMTLIGTSPNIIVSRVREEMTGEPFRMFDYLPTGLFLLLMGLVFLALGWRLLPQDRQATPGLGEAIDISAYAIEATVGAGSAAIGGTVAEFSARHEDQVQVTGLLRGTMRGMPAADVMIEEADVLILTGHPDALERVIATDRLALAG